MIRREIKLKYNLQEEYMGRERLQSCALWEQLIRKSSMGDAGLSACDKSSTLATLNNNLYTTWCWKGSSGRFCAELLNSKWPAPSTKLLTRLFHLEMTYRNTVSQ